VPGRARQRSERPLHRLGVCSKPGIRFAKLKLNQYPQAGIIGVCGTEVDSRCTDVNLPNPG